MSTLTFDLRQLVRNDITYIDGDYLLSDAARLLCTTEQRVLPVVNECLEPIGLVCDKDVLSWLCEGRGWNVKVLECMRTDFATIADTASLAEVICKFAEGNHSELLVVCDDVLVGLLRRSTLIKYLVDNKILVEI